MKQIALGKAPGLLVSALILLPAVAIFFSPRLSFANGTTNTNNPTSAQNVTMRATPNQQQAQQQAQQQNSKGSDDSKLMGILTIGLGGLQIYAGKGILSTCGGTAGTSCAMGYMMIAMGGITVLQGLKGLEGAKALANAADQGAGYTADMGCTTGAACSSANGTKTAFSIDPALLRTEPVASILSKLAAKSGVPTDKFIDAALKANGDLSAMKDVLNVGKNKLSDAKFNSMVEAANAKSNDPEAVKDALDKAGLKSALDQLAANGYGAGSSALSKSTVAKDSSFDDFLKGMNKEDPNTPGTLGMGEGANALSPEVQAALDKNGISNKSIFEMVRTQYKKQAPVLFGYDKKPASDGAMKLDESAGI